MLHAGCCRTLAERSKAPREQVAQSGGVPIGGFGSFLLRLIYLAQVLPLGSSDYPRCIHGETDQVGPGIGCRWLKRMHTHLTQT